MMASYIVDVSVLAEMFSLFDTKLLMRWGLLSG
jgi:hypothetical protein